MDVLIVGAGASGMAAALEAAKSGAAVTLLERQGRAGRKLASTGNGRCNLTNTDSSPSHWHGEDAAFAQNALERLDWRETLRWFDGMGLFTVTEPGGRVYPLSDSAGSVLDVLRLALAEAGVSLVTGAEVLAVRRERDGFSAVTAGSVFQARTLILACGGAAGASLGGGMWGYDLMESLGHRRTKLLPSLVQLKCDTTYIRALKGVRADCRACLTRGGDVLAQSEGEIQFTDYGVSGPVIFDISRGAAEGMELELDFLRSHSPRQVLDALGARREALRSAPASELFTGMLQNRLGRTIAKRAGIAPDAPMGGISDRELKRAAGLAKGFRAAVFGPMGFTQAQVTAGGVRTADFDPGTMESALVPGLYACGELLDIDGDCGGFNLQWAWASGRAAGAAAAKRGRA